MVRKLTDTDIKFEEFIKEKLPTFDVTELIKTVQGDECKYDTNV